MAPLPPGQGNTALPQVENQIQNGKQTTLDDDGPARGAIPGSDTDRASTRSGDGDGLATGMEAVDEEISAPIDHFANTSKMPNQAAQVKVKPASTSLDARTSTYTDASSSTEENARTSKTDEVPEITDIWGIAADPVWRPKKFSRNEKYPKVSAVGFYFQDHSGGFVLIRRATNEYAGFYTKLAIKELEEQYGNKQTGKAKSGSGRGRRAS